MKGNNGAGLALIRAFISNDSQLEVQLFKSNAMEDLCQYALTQILAYNAPSLIAEHSH